MVHGAGERQVPRKDRAVEEQQALLEDRDGLVEVGLYLDTERVRDERE